MAENALVRYEVLLLTVPTLTSDEAATIEKQFKDLVAQEKGEVISYEKWGKYHLAYEVKKNEYGNYYLSRFAFPAEQLNAVLEQLRQFFAVKHNDFVMRYMVARLATGASLEYKRPESMEEAPRREAEEGPKKRGFSRHEASHTHDDEGEEAADLDEEAGEE